MICTNLMIRLPDAHKIFFFREVTLFYTLDTIGLIKLEMSLRCQIYSVSQMTSLYTKNYWMKLITAEWIKKSSGSFGIMILTSLQMTNVIGKKSALLSIGLLKKWRPILIWMFKQLDLIGTGKKISEYTVG